MMVKEFGYGVDLTKMQTKEGWELELLNQPEMEDIREDFAEFAKCTLEDYSEHAGPSMEELAEEYLDSYDLFSTVGIGPFAALAEYINRKEFGGHEVFRYDDVCLYVRAIVLENEEQKMYWPTAGKIEEVLRRYLPMATEDILDIRYLQIQD